MKPKIKLIFYSSFGFLLYSHLAYAQLVTCRNNCQLKDLIFTVERIINFMLSWAWMISIFFILWASWEMINSGGNQEAIEKGKETFKHAIIGFFLIMAAYLLVNLIVGLAYGQGNPGPGVFDFIRGFLPK